MQFGWCSQHSLTITFIFTAPKSYALKQFTFPNLFNVDDLQVNSEHEEVSDAFHNYFGGSDGMLYEPLADEIYKICSFQ